jgi:peptidyl-prolyl cis-trans isomerase SurA
MDKKKIIGAVLAIAIVAFGGYKFLGKDKTEVAQVNETSVDSVAKVNGVDITKETYDNQLAASITALKGQGVDVTASTTAEAIKTQVLNDLINNELVNQGVKAAGIIATAEEINVQFQAVVTQIGGADKLAAELTKANLTEAKLKENIGKQIASQKYLLANIDASKANVTDEEVKKFYDDNSKGQKNVPAFKDIKDQIKQQLTLQKQQALAQAFVQSLREKAKIETSVK